MGGSKGFEGSVMGPALSSSNMPTVSFAADALDYFNKILTIFCRDTLTVL